MNKYAARGLAESAESGRKILVITERAATIPYALNLLCDYDRNIKAVTSTNGMQSISYHSGGRIEFRSYGSSGHRGVSVDTVFLDAGVDRLVSALDLQSLRSCVAASPTGEMIRA